MDQRMDEGSEHGARPLLTLTGAPVAAVDIVEAAYGRAAVALGPGVLDRVEASFTFAAEVAPTRPIYGRSTGVGANRAVAVTDPDAQALRLLRSHATSAGPVRSPERIRAMLLVRLNQLAVDGNGIDPAVVSSLLAMIQADALPPAREWGGIGTADLSALGTTALALLGEVETTNPVTQPVRFGAGDALTFISSSAATLGDTYLALNELERLARASLVIAALTSAAVRGNVEAFAPAVEVATPFPGGRWVCRSMRALTSNDVSPARIQDPYGLRTMPQLNGALADALAHTEAITVTMTAAASENPTVSAQYGVAHHGAFHLAYLAQSLDSLLLAVAQAAQTGLNRLTMLSEPNITGSTPFLSTETPGASGTMIVEYVAGSALAELRALAAPAGLNGISLSRGLEDDASFASLAAKQALDAIAPLRLLLAAELLAAVRGIGQDADLSPVLAPVVDAVTAVVPAVFEREDRNLTDDLEALTAIVGDLPSHLPEAVQQVLASRPGH